jgi:hypothetical protein
VAVPTLVSVGTASSGGGSVSHTATPGLPSSGVAGDLLLTQVVWLAARTGGPSPSISTPSGWTLLQFELLDIPGFSSYGIAAWYWAPQGAAAPSFTLSNGAAGNSSFWAQIIRVRGADVTAPLDAQSTFYAGTTFTNTGTINTVTTTGPDRFLLLAGFKTNAGSGGGSAGISGVVTPVSLFNVTTGVGVTGAVWRAAAASAGAQGSWATNIGGVAGIVYGKALAIKPSSSDLTVAPAFIASAEQVFTPVVTQASDLVVAPGFISSQEEFYAPDIDQGIVVGFIASQEMFFAPVVEAKDPAGQPLQPATLQRFGADVFPPGTVVSLYEAHFGWPDRAPVGRALAQQTVDSLGTFSVSGLVDRKFYVAYAFVAGRHRYLRFRYEASTT